MTDIHARIQSAELELVAKGYTEQMAAAAVNHAYRHAASIAAKVRPEIRDMVLDDLFTEGMTHAEHYANRTMAGVSR